MGILYVLIALAVLTLGASGVCFYLTFYNPTRTEAGMEADRLPPGKVYEPYHGRMDRWHDEVAAMACEAMEVTTPDGLTLRGKYYEYAPDAPIEVLFHGYRGFSERDMCGAVQRCFAVGHSALLVDQRGHGHSDGHLITFGLRECEDVPVWLSAVARRFGADRPVMIGGVSMGATTVLLAAGRGLPDNVVAVLADCGYTRARDIIQKVIRQLKLPVWPVYPLIRLGALVYGGFDPDRVDVPAALTGCRVPVIFYHGDTDDFVPCAMSRENYAACPAPKRLVVTPGAGHGLCFPADEEGYVRELREFLESNE